MDIIDKIYEALEMVSDDLKGYYNIKTGQILWISEYCDNDEDDTEELECNWENCIALPTQYEIDEYSMMDAFAYRYEGTEIGNILRNCLYGKGAFRRFKDKVFYLGIRDEWFEFRDNEYRKVAERWCRDNELIPANGKILLTAFEGTSSEKLIARLGEYISSANTLNLENDKLKSVSILSEFIEYNEYDYIFCFGQKPVIKDKVYIESCGRIDDTIYKTDFDMTRLAAALKSVGLSFRYSENAGTSYCNNLYAYGLKLIYKRRLKSKMVFIHIPFEKNISDFNSFCDKICNAINVSL